MNFSKIFWVGIIFVLGFLSANIATLYLANGYERPLPIQYLGFSGTSSISPFDYVKEDKIQIYPDKIVINIPNVSLSRYAATGSMRPVLDAGSNGIRIVPKNESDIHIGDIVSFQQGDYMIVHRIVNIGTDVNGTYFVTKGDNTDISDARIRFADIKYVTIGIIY